MNNEERLRQILSTMKVPKLRLEPLDLDWLQRNIWIHNPQHINLNEALRLIIAIKKEREK